MSCNELEYIIDRKISSTDSLSKVLSAMESGGMKKDVLLIQDFFNIFFKENNSDLRIVRSPENFEDIQAGDLLLLNITEKIKKKTYA